MFRNISFAAIAALALNRGRCRPCIRPEVVVTVAMAADTAMHGRFGHGHGGHWGHRHGRFFGSPFYIGGSC